MWGVCLGSQLLAAALGATVRTGGAPEVGVLDVELTAEAADDPVWGEHPPHFKALQWHGDTFDVPPGATHLATSTAYPGQLFRHGRSYGIQFHLEADGAMAREWLDIPAYADALEQTLGAGADEALVAAIDAAEADTVALADRAVRRWLDLVLPTQQRRTFSGR